MESPEKPLLPTALTTTRLAYQNFLMGSPKKMAELGAYLARIKTSAIGPLDSSIGDFCILRRRGTASTKYTRRYATILSSSASPTTMNTTRKSEPALRVVIDEAAEISEFITLSPTEREMMTMWHYSKEKPSMNEG